MPEKVFHHLDRAERTALLGVRLALLGLMFVLLSLLLATAGIVP